MLLDIDHVLQEDERLTRLVSPEDQVCAAIFEAWRAQSIPRTFPASF
jgi:hypothetical protein